MTNQWHNEELEWLKSELQRAQDDRVKVLVLTHHVPTRGNASACISPYPDGPVTDAFSTSLEELLRPPIACWLFGHTHTSSQLTYDVASGRLRAIEPATKGLKHPSERKLKRKLRTAECVLLASNQLGYPNDGGHLKSNFNPFMTAYISTGGDIVSLAPSLP